MRWTWHILALIGLLVGTRVAAQDAPEGGARLSWVRGVGSDSCLSGAALEAEVTRRLRRNPFHEPVTQTLEGVVQRSEQGVFTADLYDRDGAGGLVGVRRLSSESADCVALSSAVALAVALAIDPDAALTDPPVDPRPQPQPSAVAQLAVPTTRATSVSTQKATRADPPRSDPSRLRDPLRPSVRVALGALLSWQLVPGLAPGAVLDVDGRVFGPLRLAVGMLYLPEQRTEKPRADFGFGITAARVGACAEVSKRLFSASGCASAILGAIQAVVYQPSPSAPGDRFFSAFDLRAEGALVVLDPLFIKLTAAALVPFVRHRFRVEGRRSAEFQVARLVPMGILSAGVRFP